MFKRSPQQRLRLTFKLWPFDWIFFIQRKKKDIRQFNYPNNKKIIGRFKIVNAHSMNI